jgi:hypothetical protein
MTIDDSEITNISCNYIVILQDFANFKTFSKAENRLKTSKRIEQSRRRYINEGNSVFSIAVLFAL